MKTDDRNKDDDELSEDEAHDTSLRLSKGEFNVKNF